MNRFYVLLKAFLFFGVCSAFSYGAAGTISVADSLAQPRWEKLSRTYRFRVAFKDKKHSPYSLKSPGSFLSDRALARRKKYKIKVDEYDLPVSPVYLDYLRNMGLSVRLTSKWNNTAVVETADTTVIDTLREAVFVSSVRKVWTGPDSILVFPPLVRRRLVTNVGDTLSDTYGYARRQVSMLRADSLHRAGFTGKGVLVAVIDGGFYNADGIDGLDSSRVVATHNFVHAGRSVYAEQEHGTMVLSCIAANRPHVMVGTAPDADFCLLVSEDGGSEQLVEEDNWCAAVEFADSIGADIVTSSLGYTIFDDPAMTHKYYELDGRTAVNSRVASLAAGRGILLLNSAGNSGDEEWKKIGFPGDATDILTVGAVMADSTNAVFSSVGNTADGRIKPDVMAMGMGTWLFNHAGALYEANGTSFSTPLMCGGVACLLQAFPDKRPTEIIRAVQMAGNNAAHPDNIYGYGIPDLIKAFNFLKKR